MGSTIFQLPYPVRSLQRSVRLQWTPRLLARRRLLHRPRLRFRRRSSPMPCRLATRPVHRDTPHHRRDRVCEQDRLLPSLSSWLCLPASWVAHWDLLSLIASSPTMVSIRRSRWARHRPLVRVIDQRIQSREWLPRFCQLLSRLMWWDRHNPIRVQVSSFEVTATS